MGKIIFISGTDTGAGKTVLTGLLLAHLQESRVKALAMKPFCSGRRDDARLLFELNQGKISIQAVNPFYFRKPLAPGIAARLERRNVSLQDTIARIRELQAKCEILLVEGTGGLLVPLGENFMVSDLIARLGCSVLLTARNGIGVINHVLLSTDMIARLGGIQTTVVLMGKPNADISARSNSRVLRELLRGIEVFEVPFLKGDLHRADVVRSRTKNCERVLTRLIKGRLHGNSFRRTHA